MLIFEDYIKENKAEFVAKVIQICANLGIDPNWLMAIMYNESRINPQAFNKNGGATGLIQFMPDTAYRLKTSTSALYKMSNIEQLDYVAKYFSAAKGKLKSFFDLYLWNFFPVAVGKPDDFILQTNDISAEKVASMNKPFDLNKDKKITVFEFKKWLMDNLPPDIFQKLQLKISEIKTDDVQINTGNKGFLIAGIVLFSLVAGYLGYKFIIKKQK